MTNFVTTDQTELLKSRLALWDQIDAAYEQGLVPRAIELTRVVEQEITPNIRKGYGL